MEAHEEITTVQQLEDKLDHFVEVNNYGFFVNYSYVYSIHMLCNIECGNVLQLEAARGMKEFIQ